MILAIEFIRRGWGRIVEGIHSCLPHIVERERESKKQSKERREGTNIRSKEERY
jgi:hypothetical protein